MTITAKRILYVLAFFIFLTVSPLVLLYTWGYRYDFNKNSVQVTGILYIKSYPRRAAVFLNGRRTPDLTPTQITGLPPGSYEVRVEKESMQPWHKKLPIIPQRVTFAEDIVFFRSQPLLSSLAAGVAISELRPSPDGRLAATVQIKPLGNSRQLEVIDAETKQVVASPLLPPSLAPYRLSWSVSSRRLAVIGERQALVLVIGNALNPIIVAAPSSTRWTSLDWSRSNDGTLWAATPRGLLTFSLADGRWDILSPQPLLGFSETDGESLAVVATGTSAWLTAWPPNLATWQVALASSTAASYTIWPGADGLVAVHSASSATTWLVDTATTTPIVLGRWPDAQPPHWSPDGTILAIPRLNLVTILSSVERWEHDIPLTDEPRRLQWYPGGTHFYVATTHSLEVIEVDPRDERNRYQLLASPAFTGHFAITHSSRELLVAMASTSAPTGTPSGLYRLLVQ